MVLPRVCARCARIQLGSAGPCVPFPRLRLPLSPMAAGLPDSPHSSGQRAPTQQCARAASTPRRPDGLSAARAPPKMGPRCLRQSWSLGSQCRVDPRGAPGRNSALSRAAGLPQGPRPTGGTPLCANRSTLAVRATLDHSRSSRLRGHPAGPRGSPSQHQR
ncbi:hypothetical protein NDU88_007099 [Pleurodeles waltl]|uniref:Uncharacterized protein n=1 Tax=Pleurodeles waltl TaxID=8319 RepID=A0AAV7QJS9_PLEWA|nr:hypothetical protein NDU88_007099 [Pleurodeles waltl]